MSDLRSPTQRGYGRDRAPIDRELQELRDRLRQVPAAWAEAEADPTIPVISGCVGTDTLITIATEEWKGVAVPGTVPIILPQADPTELTTFPPFLGKGKLNGGGYVWIAVKVDPGDGVENDMILAIPNGQSFLYRKSKAMPIESSTETALVYFPWEF